MIRAFERSLQHRSIGLVRAGAALVAASVPPAEDDIAAKELALVIPPPGAVVGSRRMATFDDMAIEGKLTVYDKGFDEDTRSWGEYIARSGDIFSPRIPNREPLRIECEHFLECCRSGAAPRSDGRSGLRVVRVLEALQHSLERP